MTRCYIALGSNLDNPLAQVKKAVEALSLLPQTVLLAVSPWYQSKAIGPGDQPDYINGVVAVETQLSALQLLAQLQAVESSQGRVRGVRWGARTLDLDLLLYGSQSINLPSLIVPHPRMHERMFVLRPLLDLEPELSSPDGVPYMQMAAQLTDSGLQLVSEVYCSTIGGPCGGSIADNHTPPDTGDKL